LKTEAAVTATIEVA